MCCRKRELDAYAEFDILHFVAGVGIDVIGCAAMEFVALAQLAAYDDTDGHCREAR